MRTRLPLKAALLLFPVFLGTPRCLHAQERPPFTLEQIEELLAAGLAPSVIVEMAGADCLAFRLNEEAEGRLRAAGATDELITGLRNVCYGGPEPEPETPTETPPVAASSSIPLPYSPGSAALRSLAIPGLGQFYTGRPAVGALFLAGWAGALGFGFMSQDVTVECLARVGESEPCPSDQVRGKVTERPVLVVGLGAAVPADGLGPGSRGQEPPPGDLPSAGERLWTAPGSPPAPASLRGPREPQARVGGREDVGEVHSQRKGRHEALRSKHPDLRCFPGSPGFSPLLQGRGRGGGSGSHRGRAGPG